MKVRHIHKNQRIKRMGGPNIGRRHKDYVQGCGICEAYRFYDAMGRFPYSFAELIEWEGYRLPEGACQLGDIILIPKAKPHERVPRIVLDEVFELVTARQ